MAENDTLEPKFTRKQKKGIAALLTVGTVRAAAKSTGIGERQFYRWLAMPEFAQAVQTASDEALAATVRALKDASTSAVVTLRLIVSDPNAKQPVKVRAADVILGHTLRMTEIAEIEKRLSELEKAQNGKH